MRDVSRAHTRVTVNYGGLAGTARHIRYDDMYQTFLELADFTTNDEGRARAIND